MTSTTSEAALTAAPKTGAAFAYVTTLFFAWGFMTSTIDPLVAAVRSVFQLSFAEAMLTQFAWFIAYGVVSLPAAALLARLGYSRSIVSALGLMVLGCLIIPAATMADFYPGVLLALFVIASGVTWLQVAANPLVAALGKPERSHFRLVFSQAFNSLGTVIGPFVGAAVMLSGGIFAADAIGEHSAAEREASLRAIDLAFVGAGVFFALLAVFIWSARKRITAAAPSQETMTAPWSAFGSGWALFGGLAIFLYVGAEVSVGSLLTNFIHDESGWGLNLETAGKMVLFYWGGAMVGRFIGSAALTRVPAALLLSIATIVAALLCFAATQLPGGPAAVVLLSIGFFNSIMFPVIFTLTLERSSAPASSTSGLLCVAIVGGAILPVLAGQVVDLWGNMHLAFFVPMLGYLGVCAFALAATRSGPRDRGAEAAAAFH